MAFGGDGSKELPKDSTGKVGVVDQFQEAPANSSRLSFTKTLRNSTKENDYVVDILSSSRDPGEELAVYRKAESKSAGPPPITLKFEDVGYSIMRKPQEAWFEVKSWRNKMSRKKAQEKVILNGISGVVKPGELLAMLGPSGSGKTTLLNALGGRVKTGKLTGKVLYNDTAFTKGMKRRTGFVTQDDVLFQHLTVQETLVYAAYLRLPRELSKREKVDRAEAVIVQLGLEKCTDTMIGGALVRGVSGGERKRVSIGHELLIDPSLLFLDEPTSGLDSTIALKIIHILKQLASSGRTVVTTIHQPSSIIFHTFNKLLLLSEGHVLYYGQGSNAMSYFESVGFRPAFATNPADFLLDLANGIAYVNHDEGPATDVIKESTEAEFDKNLLNKMHGRDDILATLRDAYNTTLLTKTRNSISQIPAPTDEELKADQERRKWPTTWFDQLLILMSRGIKERRHEVFAGLRIAQVTAISIICGLLWWQSSPDNITNQVGLLFFLTTFWGFIPVFAAIFTFPQERKMLVKERASGMYRLSAYFVSRTIADLPLELTLPSLSLTVVYWMGGLKATAGAYFASLCAILFNVIVAQGLGLFLGAVVMEVKQATALSSVILLSFQLAGGYFVQSTPSWINWIKYTSYSYYSYKLQLTIQYSPTQTYPCATGRCLVVDNPSISNVGVRHLGISLMALCIMSVGYRVLAYLALKRTVH